MDQQTGGVPLGSPSGSPAGGRGSEEQKVLPPGEEVMVSDPVVTGEEEVGEEPQLPKEPCRGRPAPWGYKVRQMLQQLVALGTAASAALRSLRERGSAGLRGASSRPEVEETSPMDQAQMQSASISASAPDLPAANPNPSPSDSVDPATDSATDEYTLGLRGTSSKPEVEETSPVDQAQMQSASILASAPNLPAADPNPNPSDSVDPVTDSATDKDTLGIEQTSSLPTLASPLDVKQPGNPIPHPDEVAAGEKLV
ncbi:hypothetical protein, conserved [Eimeria praecox]|uniref:Uncharacterized protein n=1 Tax=Eimeria praecox TaxID=51316 RepID=U6GSP6_9EIME|nr:hypothetical protein, conserved [Eimeria praecox]